MTTIQIKLSKELKERVNKAAEAEGLSVSAFIVKSIKEFINGK